MMTNIPPFVFIFPMSKDEEFPSLSIEQLQMRFFLGVLPAHPGDRFRYRANPPPKNAGPGTVVLFQSDARIMASAVLVWIEPFAQPEDGKYNGAMWFHPGSIRIFEQVDANGIQRIWPTFTESSVRNDTVFSKICRKTSGFSDGSGISNAGLSKQFGNVMQELDPPGSYLRFAMQLRGVAAPVLPAYDP
ncbi:MAG TPA: hypothetical protein VMF69_10300 [Gemmataceae bacterium]|nr:hypothetical protein [Gemmataceae bacterium]